MVAAFLLFLSGLYGAVAVALGAYAAHGMDASYAPQAVAWVETASHYQLLHAAAMLAMAAAYCVAHARPVRIALVVAGALFAFGALVFPGSLYALAFVGGSGFGALAPVGGGALILGWLAVAGAGMATVRSRRAGNK